MEPMTFVSVFQDAVSKVFIAMHAVTQGFALCLTACTAGDNKLNAISDFDYLTCWQFRIDPEIVLYS
jgi:hypothetical protein